MNTEEEHKAWHKRCAAMMKRADTEGQTNLCLALSACGYDDSTILIELERKYFLNRKQSTTILESL